jgi:TonB-like protein
MYFRRLSFAILTLLLTASLAAAQAPKAAAPAQKTAAPAQKTADPWAEWESITPEGEEFTVTMPKNPTTETAKFPYHKMELNTRLYLAKSATGPVLAIASFSGIKSNPAQYTEFQRFNSYVDAFKDFFPPKVRTKDTALTKLTLTGSRPFHGHTGRSYKLAIGELNGVMHAFVTRKRFYAIVSLNTKKDDALEDKFLSSFVLPEREPDAAKSTAANDTPAQEQQPGNEQTIDDKPPSAEQKQAQQGDEGQTGVAPKKQGEPGPGGEVGQPQTPPDPNQKKGPINGGVLNSKAIYMPKPEAPGDANGVVLVQVLVDEQGSVIDAKAVAGPPNLHAVAVNAARLARFMPTVLSGVPVQVAGTLSYNFVRSN